MINIEKIVSYDFDQNCYLVYEDKNNAVLIDPGFDTFKILKACEENGVNVTHIFITHCHYDHIYSVNELRGHKKVVCSKRCSENMGKASYNLSAGMGIPFIVEPADITVSDGEKIVIGNMEIKAIETKGHTDCGFCYLIEDSLFTGDTLFKQNVGRWDFPTGDEQTLYKSIREKLYVLDENVKVYPGHGADTSIGYEKKFNFFVN